LVERRAGPGHQSRPYRLYNIGSNRPVELMRYIEVLEECLGRTAIKNLLPLQAGDVPDTYADVDALIRGCRLSAIHAGRGRRGPLRGLVSGVLSGLTEPVASPIRRHTHAPPLLLSSMSR
jgi:hypothetical protein